MVKKEELGNQHYSHILERNVTIKEGLEDEWYKAIGLECVLVSDEKPLEKAKLGKQKENDSDK